MLLVTSNQNDETSFLCYATASRFSFVISSSIKMNTIFLSNKRIASCQFLNFCFGDNAACGFVCLALNPSIISHAII